MTRSAARDPEEGGLQLRQRYRRWVGEIETGRRAQIVAERAQRAILVKGRGREIDGARSIGERAIPEVLDEPGLSDTGFSRDQNHIAVGPHGAPPLGPDRLQLALAPMEGCQPACPRGNTGAVLRRRFADRTPWFVRSIEAPQLHRTDRLAGEARPDPGMRLFGQDDAVAPGQALQTGGEVSGGTDDRAGVYLAPANRSPMITGPVAIPMRTSTGPPSGVWTLPIP
jgi:hypothetical protein